MLGLKTCTTMPDLGKEFLDMTPEAQFRAGGVAQAVEHLSSKCKALSSNPSRAKKKQTNPKPKNTKQTNKRQKNS
jgi:hypothetical protein